MCCDLKDVTGCNMTPVEGADPGDSSLVYLCSALSREDGTFVFPSLASGEYTVVSSFNEIKVTWLTCIMSCESLMLW